MNVLEGEVRRIAYLGNVVEYGVAIGEWELRVREIPVKIHNKARS